MCPRKATILVRLLTGRSWMNSSSSVVFIILILISYFISWSVVQRTAEVSAPLTDYRYWQQSPLFECCIGSFHTHLLLFDGGRVTMNLVLNKMDIHIRKRILNRHIFAVHFFLYNLAYLIALIWLPPPKEKSLNKICVSGNGPDKNQLWKQNRRFVEKYVRTAFDHNVWFFLKKWI